MGTYDYNVMKKAYFDMLYSGAITVEKVQELLGIPENADSVGDSIRISVDEKAWMRGGHRGILYLPRYLCYWCVEELVGPGMGKVNDFCLPPKTGKPKRKLTCSWCGKGTFNRKGERIGAW
jgi:hypothetical protein